LNDAGERPENAILSMRKYVFACLIVVSMACVKEPLPPPNTLSKDQMINILIDIHLAEAKVGRLPFRSLDSSKALFRKMELDIFKKHQVDTATYRKSFEFYLNNTSRLDEIYAAVIDSLSYRESTGKME
jgi:hypothetical protein